MENPTGESVDGPLRLDFDRRLKAFFLFSAIGRMVRSTTLESISIRPSSRKSSSTGRLDRRRSTSARSCSVCVDRARDLSSVRSHKGTAACAVMPPHAAARSLASLEPRSMIDPWSCSALSWPSLLFWHSRWGVQGMRRTTPPGRRPWPAWQRPMRLCPTRRCRCRANAAPAARPIPHCLRVPRYARARLCRFQMLSSSASLCRARSIIICPFAKSAAR
jgi:hypothetical protein